MVTFLAILEAISASATIMAFLDKWGAAFVGWWISKQNRENGQAINDALYKTLKGPDTKQGRIDAAKAWQDAISRSNPN